eukprot:6942759-Alexandrium_andersonii.AAC.1
MSASLVGSEMCIRDRGPTAAIDKDIVLVDEPAAPSGNRAKAVWLPVAQLPALMRCAGGLLLARAKSA